jgi:hypothetical protein
MNATSVSNYKGKLIKCPSSLEQKECNIIGRTMKIFPNDKMDNISLTGLSMASESVGSDKVKCFQTEKGFRVEENEDFSILNQSDAIPIDACHFRKVKAFKCSFGENIESKQEQWNSDNIVEDLDGADLGLIDFRNTNTDLGK